MNRFPRPAALSLCLLLSVLASIDARAQADPTLILSYEPIELEFADEQDPLDLLAGSVASLKVRAFGREFTAHVSQSRALIRNLPAEDRLALADIAIWQGDLDNIAGSWIRLVQRGDFVSGALSDGTTTYRIEPFEYARARLVAPVAQNQGGLIIYPRSATLGALGDIVVAVESAVAERQSGKGALLLSFKPALLQGLEVEIAVVADTEFSDAYGANASAEALARINDADFYVVQQLGVHLGVAALQIFTTEPDPFSSSDPPTLLSQLESYKGSTIALRDADLAHLITGKSLGGSGQSQTVGIARLRSLCLPTQGVAISAVGGGIITAHEIAHNFGATHDGEAGTACASAPPGYLMDAVLTGQSVNQGTFSACSVDVMLQAVSTASCLSPIPPSDLVLTVTRAPTSVIGNQDFNIEFELENIGTRDVFAIEVEFDSPSATFREIVGLGNFSRLDCDRGASPVICRLHRLPPGAVFRLDARMNATAPGDIAIGVTAWSLNDSDPGNNAVIVPIFVRQSVDLNVRHVVVSPPLAIPGQLVTVSMDIPNTGTADATDVFIELRAQLDDFDFVSAQLPGGAACSIVPPGFVMECPVGSIPVGATVPISLVYRARDPNTPGNIIKSNTLTIQLYSAEHNLSSGQEHAPLNVTNSVADIGVSIRGPNFISIGGDALFAVTIENRGPDTASSIFLDLLNPGVEHFFSGTVGCVFSASRDRVQCPIPQLDPGISRVFTFGGPVHLAGSFTAQATVTVGARDLEIGDNTATLAWTAPFPATPTPTPSPVPAPAASSGGGGGALDPIALLLLSLVWACSAGIRFRQHPHVLAASAFPAEWGRFACHDGCGCDRFSRVGHHPPEPSPRLDDQSC